LKSALAPTLDKSFGDYYVLWYANSNSYSIVDGNFKDILDLYLGAPDLNAFQNELNHLSAKEVQNIKANLDSYLSSCQVEQDSTNRFGATFDKNHRNLSKTYKIGDNSIRLYSDRKQVEDALHPSLAQYEISASEDVDTVFDVYLNDSNLHLFQNEALLLAVPKKEYHFIQGKFHMAVSNLIHHKNETDWLGTLHGSTITNGDTALLFIGNSGSGKSTLCSLLVAHGYSLLADDISPLAKSNTHVYYNPAAISIKENAFKVIEPLLPQINTLPEIFFTPSKGVLKYLPCPRPEHSDYPCKAIVLVNYTPESTTQLETISVKEVLETIIPDSWLHPGIVYADAFLNWLSTTSFYKLTYSDTDSMVKTISDLFKA
jgi:hypothetical protein